MRRIFWLALGLGAGTTAAILAGRWARRQSQKLAPAHIGNQARETAGDARKLLSEALEEFRRGREEREKEIRSSLPE